MDVQLLISVALKSISGCYLPFVLIDQELIVIS